MCSFGPMESAVDSDANICQLTSEMLTAVNASSVSLLSAHHKKATILSWEMDAAGTSETTRRHIEDHNFDWAVRRCCSALRERVNKTPTWLAECATCQIGLSLAQGTPTSCTQIKPVAQSCPGIIKGQSEVLKPLAHSSVNYTAGRISAIITGRSQWNYNGKKFENLWLFVTVHRLCSTGLISSNVSLNKSLQNGYTVACHCNAVLSDCIYWIGISATLNCASCKPKQNVH